MPNFNFNLNVNHNLDIKIKRKTRVLLQSIFNPLSNEALQDVLEEIRSDIKEIHRMDQEMVDMLQEIDDATTEIASDIESILANATSIEEVKTALRPKVERLKQIAADTNNPVPEETPQEPGGGGNTGETPVP